MNNPIGTFTLFQRESRRFLKVYLQTIFSPVIGNLLYLAIFTLSLNRAIPNVEGISYLQFLVPGLIIMGIVNNCFQNSSSSIIISKYQGIISDLLIIPLKKYEILIAYITSSMLRGIIVGIVTLITASFFVTLPYHSIPIVLFSTIVVSAYFSFLGLIIGIWAKGFDNVAFIQTFILTPMIFLGGVFYPIQNLPSIFRTISSFNPIVYMIDLLRYGFTGVNAFPVLQSIAINMIGLIIFAAISYKILKSGWHLQS